MFISMCTCVVCTIPSNGNFFFRNVMKWRHLLNVITTKLVILISHHRYHERGNKWPYQPKHSPSFKPSAIVHGDQHLVL